MVFCYTKNLWRQQTGWT